MQRASSTELPNGGVNPLAGLHSQAQVTGDVLLERAAMVTALERQDTDILNAWIEDHPFDYIRVQEMLDLQYELSDTKTRFVRALNFAAV